jgi:hypothetical protein
MDGCPHVNRNDPRCGSRFSLGRLDQAFCVCFGTYHACPMYHRINDELARVERPSAAIVTTTISRYGLNLPFRATGS